MSNGEIIFTKYAVAINGGAGRMITERDDLTAYQANTWRKLLEERGLRVAIYRTDYVGRDASDFAPRTYAVTEAG